MVGKIELIHKWKQFIEETEDKNSAYQMGMTMMNVIALDVAAERCDSEDMMDYTENVAYALKNIENDDNIDYGKRKDLANDLVRHIKEQRDLFTRNCKCMKK